MLLEIERILGDDDLAAVRNMIAREQFSSGKATAKGAAERVKNNLEIPRGSPAAREGGELILRCFRHSAIAEAATAPKAILFPMFNRFDSGMFYGDHLDWPLAVDPQLRIDISVTLFLSDPKDYDGGELVIETDYGKRACKGSAGDCVIYPSSMLHRIEPVTRGSRLAAVFWIQSLIRNPDSRRILFDLWSVLNLADLAGNGGGAIAQRLRRSYCNLLRMWSDT